MSQSLKEARKTSRKLRPVEKRGRFAALFRAWRDHVGVSGYAIESATGYLRANLSAIENGRIDPSDDFLRKVSSMPELGLDYQTLLAWKLMDSYPFESVKRVYDFYVKENPGMRDTLDEVVGRYVRKWETANSVIDLQ